MRLVEGLGDEVDSLVDSLVDSFTRANTGKLIVLIVCCHPYVCACSRMCICTFNYQNYQNYQPLLSKLLIIVNKIRLIVCLKINQTISKLSTINK